MHLLYHKIIFAVPVAQFWQIQSTCTTLHVYHVSCKCRTGQLVILRERLVSDVWPGEAWSENPRASFSFAFSDVGTQKNHKYRRPGKRSGILSVFRRICPWFHCLRLQICHIDSNAMVVDTRELQGMVTGGRKAQAESKAYYASLRYISLGTEMICPAT